MRSEARTASSQSGSDQPARSADRSNTGSQYVSSVRVPSGSMRMIVPGGSLRTPRRIVCGAGTTEWKRQVVVQRDRVDLGVDPAGGHQRGQRGREAQAPVPCGSDVSDQ